MQSRRCGRFVRRNEEKRRKTVEESSNDVVVVAVPAASVVVVEFSQACEIGRDDADVEKRNKIIEDDVVKSEKIEVPR